MKPVIGGIIKNGPADKSNLKANDVIVKIGNTKINYASDIRKKISSIPNQNVLIDVYRDGDLLQFPLKLVHQKILMVINLELLEFHLEQVDQCINLF